MKTKENRLFHVLWPILLIATTLVIWSFSLTPAKQSSEQSGFIRDLLMRLLGNGAFAELFFTYIPVRKLAHFTEYCVLGGEWAGYGLLKKKKYLYACGLPVAVIDELLQFLSPGRAPAVKDVLIDTAGFLCGCILVWAAAALWHKRRR